MFTSFPRVAAFVAIVAIGIAFLSSRAQTQCTCTSYVVSASMGLGAGCFPITIDSWWSDGAGNSHTEQAIKNGSGSSSYTISPCADSTLDSFKVNGGNTILPGVPTNVSICGGNKCVIATVLNGCYQFHISNSPCSP